MYEKLEVPWIIDISDTVQAYEEKGNQDGENGKHYGCDQLFNILSGMDRFQQVEAIHSKNFFFSFNLFRL